MFGWLWKLVIEPLGLGGTIKELAVCESASVRPSFQAAANVRPSYDAAATVKGC